MGWSYACCWIYAHSVKQRYRKMKDKEDDIDHTRGSVLYIIVLCLELVEAVLENNHKQPDACRVGSERELLTRIVARQLYMLGIDSRRLTCIIARK